MEMINKRLKGAVILICISLLMITRYTMKIGSLETLKDQVREYNLSPDIIYDSTILQENYSVVVFVFLIILSFSGVMLIMALKDKELLNRK